jgi:hypothetical protein
MLAEVPLADLSFVEEYVDRMPFAFNGRLGKVVDPAARGRAGRPMSRAPQECRR